MITKLKITKPCWCLVRFRDRILVSEHICEFDTPVLMDEFIENQEVDAAESEEQRGFKVLYKN